MFYSPPDRESARADEVVSAADEAAWAALDQLAAGVDALLKVDTDAVAQDVLLEVLRGVEGQRRRLDAVDHRLIAGVEQRAVAAAVMVRSTAELLWQLLRVTPGQAKARVRAARDLGPRRAVSGQAQPATFPRVAAGMARGEVSTAQARVIIAAIDALPAQIAAVHGAQVETDLVAHAATSDPHALAAIADRIHQHLDPDGTAPTEGDRARRRGLTVTQRRDKSGRLQGELTPECLARLLAVLDPLAKPRPAAGGMRDERTPAQRRHDALDDMCRRLLDSGSLPAVGGSATTVVVTMTLEQLLAGTGTARTAHDGTLDVGQLLREAANAKILPAVLDRHGAIVALGHAHRLANDSQQLVLGVRDRGCSAPGCTMPPAWCVAHHTTDWRHRRFTDVGHLALACSYHHRVWIHTHGWRIDMINGRPWWIPPAWLDPDQTPQLNTTHHPRPHHIPPPPQPRQARRPQRSRRTWRSRRSRQAQRSRPAQQWLGRATFTPSSSGPPVDRSVGRGLTFVCF